MQDRERQLAELHDRLGLKQLNRAWAKAEIFLGLTTAGAGLFLGVWSVSRTEVNLVLAFVGLALFVLGGYLAMAGHRSHLYQSSNELTAYLVEEIRRTGKPGGIE